MGKKIIYNCDICRENKNHAELIGLNFSGMKEFKFDTAASTDGVHICMDCIRQIKEQIAVNNI